MELVMKIIPWLLPSLFVSVPVFAEGIATDGSMGTPQTLTGNAVTIPQELGKTVGNNLFHSFSDFNINNGQAVTFTGSDSLQNVISRVSGNNPSIIDGTLKSDIKNADFYFINPHGITFNANAQVDVPAAFHVSTADKIDFGRNGVFYVDLTKDSQLSSEPPSAFGFLGNSTIGNGLVDINNAHLQLKDGKIFDVVSGSINIKGKGYQDDVTRESLEPTVKSTGGEVRLVAFAGPGNVSLQRTDLGALALPIEDNAAYGGEISINGGYVDTSGDGAGRVSVYGGGIVINNGELQTDNTGNTLADKMKGINISAKNIELINSYLSSSTTNFFGVDRKGNAGDITLISVESIKLNTTMNRANFIHEDNCTVYSETNTNGDGGDVIIKAKDLELVGSSVSTRSSRKMFDMANSSSTIITQGNAGNIYVDVTGSIKILTEKEFFSSSDIYSTTNTNGHAGNIVINAKEIELYGGNITNSTSIYENRDSNFYLINSILTYGNAGNITVNVSDTLKLHSFMYKDLDNFLLYNFSSIDSRTFSNGNAGYTLVNARNLEIKGDSGIGVSSSSALSSFEKWDNHIPIFVTMGNTGDVIVNVADSITMTAEMSVSSDGINEYPLYGYIRAETETNGYSGNVTVNAKSINLTAGRISTSSNNFQGHDKDWNSFQTSNANGKAGKVTVKANELILDGENADVNTSTYNKILAGEIDIHVGKIKILNNASVSSGSFGIDSSGQTGAIRIDVKDLNLESGGSISIKNEAVVENNPHSVPVGTIDIHAKNIIIDDALITSESTGNVNAGNIYINYYDLFKLTNKAFINATSLDGNGGYISIKSPSGVLSLQNSRMATTATGAISNGGNIDINSDIMMLNTGSLLASTIGGTGGNITLNLQSLVPSSNNLLEVGSKQFNWKLYSGLNVLGASGFVKSNVPQLNLSGVLANITNASMDNNLISQDYCALGQGSSLSKKGKGALPMRPKNFQSF
jgi:filamentous hemagglutinin family protein